MAMLHVMASLKDELKLRLVAHGVDHGLRPEASAELDLAEQLAAQLGLEFGRTSLEVLRGPNLQARARHARHGALLAAGQRLGLSLIATAHHADDRAETLLMRMLRGSGPHGLGVLPARDDTRLRPLIRARRSDILSHLSRNGLSHAEDPSNADLHYLRVRVRRELLPLLDGLSPGVVGSLCAIADALWQARKSDSSTGSALGRAQRESLERALVQRQIGFSLPLKEGMLLTLIRSNDPGLRTRRKKQSQPLVTHEDLMRTGR